MFLDFCGTLQLCLKAILMRCISVGQQVLVSGCIDRHSLKDGCTFLFFKINKLLHQSNPGPHLYLCMYLLLQVAQRELRRHKQPKAIDKRRHSFTTIAVMPSASNPPVKNVHKKNKKQKKLPSCCRLSFIFKKSSQP